jgi:hypothetical protein
MRVSRRRTPPLAWDSAWSRRYSPSPSSAGHGRRAASLSKPVPYMRIAICGPMTNAAIRSAVRPATVQTRRSSRQFSKTPCSGCFQGRCKQAVGRFLTRRPHPPHPGWSPPAVEQPHDHDGGTPCDCRGTAGGDTRHPGRQWTNRDCDSAKHRDGERRGRDAAPRSGVHLCSRSSSVGREATAGSGGGDTAVVISPSGRHWTLLSLVRALFDTSAVIQPVDGPV